ncbi:endonuclease NucS domain-containing protein [Halobacterium litoreum]|uniref:Endonuclease NucS domain-containing protein n=1 Tax=Halobacterium litoreum TaxID=2039234 RepID=A0ABD5NGA1_9EURY|nr:endonuclease NucS domain-containing protein [Halobacterium litoreum]UHH13140.1 endonuclease NucS [Halobacterium litoreum]
MQDAIRVLAGECAVRYEAGGETERTLRGDVVVLVKPDDTVLVHDSDGYQPAAWLTRPGVVRYTRDARGFRLDAADGDERLVVESATEHGDAHYPASPAGPPVGTCGCEGTLVRDGGRVVCVDCRAQYAIPRDAAVVGETCEDCGLPLLRVERGVEVTACLDRDCEPIADAVRGAVGDWTCRCGGGLSVEADRGLHAACEDCGARHRLPRGTAADDSDCDCGFPAFDTRDGPRCLDADCARAPQSL